MQMETYMRVNGSTIKLMVTEPTNMQTVLLTSVSGSKTNNTEQASRNGQTVPSTKDNIKMERNTEMDA
jgi:aerobic-type carbon monoxide dehydrogenase small subunit (CoxS/CutS family)